jgi:hypothetical protein
MMSISEESVRYGITYISKMRHEISPPSKLGVNLRLHCATSSVM